MGTIVHTKIMAKVRRSSIFIRWLKRLKDRVAKALIVARIKRLEEGNPGDSDPIGEGLSEMRIHYGPGYRVYFKNTGKEIIILLCGGDKSTQQSDIIKAKRIAKHYKEE